MQTHWVFNGCEERVKESAQAYWAKKAHRLERLLSRYPPALRELRLTLYKHARPDCWELRAALHLPTATLATEQEGESLESCLDRANDVLVAELKRHREQLRQDYLFRRKRRRRARLSAAGPLLARDRAASRREAFFDLLRPILDSLRPHCRRALRALARDHKVAAGAITVDEVTDEVLVRAWDEFDRRPPQMPLDVWLMGLVDEVLAKLAQQPEALSLDRPAAHEPSRDEEDWMEETENEPVSLAELLPSDDRQSKELESEDLLERLAAGLPPEVRQAAIWNLGEGYDPAEIAMIQNRPEADVRADLEAARQQLSEAWQKALHAESAENS